jgi:hypothetical protein
VSAPVAVRGEAPEGLRRELLLAVGWGLVVFAVTLVPYVVAYVTAPAGKDFNGFFYLGDDAATYIAKMRQGMDGAWGWSDPYISTPTAQPVLLFLFYILWGKVAGLLHVSLFAAYHLARLSSAVALVYAARRLAAAALPPGRARVVAVVLAVAGAGAGYILAVVSGLTGLTEVLGQPLDALDLHLPELSGFYSVLAIPHFGWAAALLALALERLMATATAPNVGATARAALAAATAMLLLCLIHPQMLFILAPLAAAHLAFTRAPLRAWVGAGLTFLACVPLLLYFLRVLTDDPVIQQWSSQWRHQAPGFVAFIFGLGVPLGLAVYAVIAERARLTPAQRTLAVWVVLVILLLYLPNPVNIQRRLIDGIYLPIAMLAALGIDMLARRRATRRARARLATYAVAASMMSSLVVVAIGMSGALTAKDFLYIDHSEVAALDWLSGQRGSGTPPAVLSHPDTGLHVPELSGLRVYAGHYSETLDSTNRARRARDEMRAGGAELVAFMRANDVSYLYVGPLERASGVGGLAPGLEVVYDSGGVTVYRLRA